jgi:hypothetical protein
VKTRVIAVVIAATLGAGSATAYAATLGIGSWHLWTGSQTLTKATCTITSTSSANAINDTYVSEAQTGTSFGSATTMNVRADLGNRAWTFVRFDLSSCALPSTAGADTATLKLVVKTPANNSRTLTLTPVLATWAETLTAVQAFALPFGSAPTTTFLTGTTAGATLSIPVTIDIDALIKDSTANFGWRIDDEGTTTNANLTIFNSSEATTAALRPQLVINYEK